MTRYEQARFDMLLRVRDFGTAHRGRFPESSTAGKAFAAVSAAVTTLEAHATARVLAAEEGKKAKRAAFRLPKQRSDQAWLTSARAFIREGEAVKARFVTFGMPDTFVTNLQELTGSFEQAIRGWRVGKSGLAALAGIKTALGQGLDAARTLDVVLANSLDDDPVLLAAWARARRVEAKPRTTRVSAKSAATSTGDAPPPAAPAPAPAEAATTPEPAAVAAAPETAAPAAPVAPEKPLKRRHEGAASSTRPRSARVPGNRVVALDRRERPAAGRRAMTYGARTACPLLDRSHTRRARPTGPCPCD